MPSLSVGLSCSQIQYQRQTISFALTLVGGATDSIFPQVEALLMAGDLYASALKYVARRKKMDRYMSVIDFLFCELHPQWKLACRRYYESNGAPLRDQITISDLAQFNSRMLIALEVAVECHKEQLRKDWGWYRELIENRLAA